jgi:hypothetical protein
VKLNEASKKIMTDPFPHYDLLHTPAEDEVFNKYGNDINTYQKGSSERACRPRSSVVKSSAIRIIAPPTAVRKASRP